MYFHLIYIPYFITFYFILFYLNLSFCVTCWSRFQTPSQALRIKVLWRITPHASIRCNFALFRATTPRGPLRLMDNINWTRLARPSRRHLSTAIHQTTNRDAARTIMNINTIVVNNAPSTGTGPHMQHELYRVFSNIPTQHESLSPGGLRFPGSLSGACLERIPWPSILGLPSGGTGILVE